MSPKPQSNSPQDTDQQGADPSTQRQALPFEPKGRKPSDRKADSKVSQQKRQAPASPRTSASKTVKGQPEQSRSAASSIPEVVSRRMARRMALFCGIPTFLGMSTFVVSYLIVSNELIKLPTYAVLLVSLGWFGLGVVGLTYGVLSASWDEDVAGSRLGWSEFITNWQRMTSAWRANSEQAKANRSTSEPSKTDKKS